MKEKVQLPSGRAIDLSPERDLFDITIIGGGPTGLFASFYAGLRGMRTKIVDSLDHLGGQLSALYPEKLIYDVAGFPAVLAKTLSEQLVLQAMTYEPTLALNEQVRRLERIDEQTLRLETDRAVHWSRTVLIAAGMGAFTPKRLPARESDRFEGRGLHYFVKELSEFAKKRILVIGGGDSAVDWSLNLMRVTDRVTLIHRRDAFRAHEDSVQKMFASGVTVRTFHELKEIGGNGQVEWATIFNNRTKEETKLEVDAVLVNIGFESSLGPIRDWGLALDDKGIIVNSMMQTNLPGVFAAGDVVNFPGKLKLIATGFGEAATAVNHAKVFIDPTSQSFPGHSTSIVPKQRAAKIDKSQHSKKETADECR